MTNPSYILYLLLFVGFFYVLFWGYAVIARKLLPFLGGLSQGFIAFLAVNEIVALPFIGLGLSFRFYFAVFLLLNAPFFAVGLINLIRKLPRLIRFRPSRVLLAVAAFTLAVFSVNAVLTQYFVKYDADDAYNVSLIEQNLTEDALYQSDPVSGREDFPLAGIYVLGSWELMESAFVKIVDIPSVELAHNFVPLLIIPLVAHASYVLFRFFAKRDIALLATAFLGIIYLYSGYSLITQGTFLLTRSWQGKAIVATLVIPLLLAAYSHVYKKPTEIRLYICIGILHVAAIALNPAATFIGVVAACGFGLLLLLKHRKLKPLVWLGLTTLPLVAGGLFAVFSASQSSPNTDLAGVKSYPLSDYLTRQLGTYFKGAWYGIIYLIGVIVVLRNNRFASFRPLFVWFPLVLFATFLNPLFYNFVYGYFTASAYWRMFWLTPVAVGAALFLAIFIFYVHKRVQKNVPRVIGLTLFVLLIAFSSLFIIGSGKFMFDVSRPLVAKDASRAKVPPGVAEIGNYFKVVPTSEVILAPEDPAAYIHNFTERHELFLSRMLYVRIYFQEGTQEYKEAVLLYQTLNEGINLYDIELSRYMELLREHNITAIVYRNVNVFMEQLVADQQLEPSFVGSEYSIVHIPRP